MPALSPLALRWRAWAWALAAVLAWDATPGDLAVAHLFGDVHGFAARHAFWAEALLHNGLRWLTALAVAWMVFDLWRPAWAAEGPTRGERAWALAGTVLALLVVPAIKSQSGTSCPWSLSEFGGVARWVSHWDWGQPDGGGGHCFPSGHAVGSFAFFSSLWVWRGVPRVQRGLAAAILLAGFLGSLAQWARGAHFVSHSLWSALACAALTAAWQWVGDRRRAIRPIACLPSGCRSRWPRGARAVGRTAHRTGG